MPPYAANDSERLPHASDCIDCDARLTAVPVFVRAPKEANFATRLNGKWPGEPPLRDDVYAIYQCSACGSTFLHPTYFQEAASCYDDRRYFEGYYPQNIHTGGHPNDAEPKFPALRQKLEAGRARWLVELARKYSPQLSDSPSFLDIGCATGLLVWGALAAGLDAFGVEVSHQAQMAKKRCGEDRIHHGYFDETCLGGRQFHLIVLMQTAEHIQDLSALLKLVQRRLNPGGALVVVSPNDMGGYRPLFWRRVWWLIPPMHVRYFSPQSFARMLDRCGLKLLGSTTTGSFGLDVFMVLTWAARRLRISLRPDGLPFKVLRQAFERMCRPLDWVIVKTVGHSELVLVAGLANPDPGSQSGEKPITPDS